VTVPEYTPGTLGLMDAIVNDVPSAETAVTRLNVSSPVVVAYPIIDPTFTPVKNFPGLTSVFPPLIVT
jgi:hypothetical protein